MSHPHTQPYWRLDFLGDNSDADRGLVPFSYLFKVGGMMLITLDTYTLPDRPWHLTGGQAA